MLFLNTIISDREPSNILLAPLVSESAGELERDPLHPNVYGGYSTVGLPHSLNNDKVSTIKIYFK